MSMDKKGVTEPVLIIGVLVLAATILLLGTTRVMVPLIKSQPTFLANQGALAIDAVLAAPENIASTETFRKESDKTIKLSVYGGKVTVKRECHNTGYDFHEDSYVEDKLVKNDFQCPNKQDIGCVSIGKDCYWWTGKGADNFKIKISKLYSKASFEGKDYKLVLK